MDYDIVQSGYEEVADVVAGGYFEGLKTSVNSGIGFYSVCPGWNGDLRWISSGNSSGFDFFDRYFTYLDIANKTKQVIGDCGDLIMYSGFFVVRSYTSQSYYHVDYSAEVGLNAFTLMTPVTRIGETGNLLYHDLNESENVYKYERGRCVCFGGGFYHSTEPFKSTEPYIFLCFTFGVADMQLWPTIAETAADQGLYYRHPERGIVKAI